MLGFSGAINHSGLDEVIKSRVKKSNFGVQTLENKISYFENKNLSTCIFNQEQGIDSNVDNELVCIAIGNIYSRNKEIFSLSKEITKIYREKGISHCCTQNGLYSFIIYDDLKRLFFLGVDQNSVIQTYFSHFRDTLFFSWHIPQISYLSNHNLKIDEDHFFRTIFAGPLGLNSSTPVKNVKALYGGSYIKFKENKLKQYKISPFYYEPKFDLSALEHIDRIKRSLLNAIKMRISNIRNIAIGISGGLDSRILLGLISKLDNIKINGYTYGCKGFVESKVAKEIMEYFKFRHLIFEFNDLLYLDYAGDGISLSSGTSIFKHGIQFHLFNTIKKEFSSQGTILGSALDLTIGDSYNLPKSKNLDTKDDLINFYIRRLFNLDLISFKNLCNKKENYFDAIESVRECIQTNLKQISYSRFEDLNSSYLFKSRVKKWYNQNLIYHLINNKLILPTYDTHFLKSVSQVPYELRENDSFRKELLISINKDISKINQNDTMQPAYLPGEYCRFFSKQLEEIDQYKEKIWFSSKQSIYIPSNRYDANFKEYYRVYPEYKYFFESLVLDPSSIITSYFKKDNLKKIFDDHISGKCSNHKIINLLLSAELSCRMYNGEDIKLNNKAQNFLNFII